MKIIEILISPQNKLLAHCQVLLLVCAVVLTMPDLSVDTAGPVDASWMIALHKADIQGMIHGKDIVFTYGPLGFLTAPIFISRNQWLYSAVYTLSVYVLTILSFSLYVRKTRANLVNTIILTVIFVAVFSFRAFCSGSDFGLPLSVFIFSYLYVLGEKRLPLLFGLAFLYSVLPFIKFTYALMVFITGVAFLFGLVMDKRYKEALIFMTSGLAAMVTLSLLLIGPPKAIVMYFYGCLQISGGYSDAMAIDGDTYQLLFSVFAWLSYIVLLSYNAFKKKRPDLIYLAFSFSLLFVSFKHGFVRHDEHVISFYSTWMLVFALYYLRSFSQTKVVKYAVLMLIFMMLYQYVSIPDVSRTYTVASIADKLENVRFDYDLLKRVGTEEQKTEETGIKKDLSWHYGLKTETIRMLSGHTIDIFPWDDVVAELYGFNWRPRPVFQSYSAYTEYLDSINANHFLSPDAPEYVLYSMKSIDGRYPFFDEPATFRILLQRYELCAMDGEFIVLRRKDSVDIGKEEYIYKTVVKFGEMISLPKVDDGLLFAKIHIEYNLLGNTLKFLFKPPKVFFGFSNNGQNIGVYRFIFSNAGNGVFLSQYIDSYDSCCEVFGGNIRKNLSEISISTSYPVCFNDKITIEFFK